MFNHHLKSSLFGALALTGGLLAAKADYPSEVLADGPLAYYRLNENVTTPTFDVATNAGSVGALGNGTYASTTHGAAGAIVAQPGNTAVTFPGAGSLSVPYQAALNVAGPFTFEFWAKPVAAASSCPASSIKLGNSGWLFYNSTLVAGQWSFRTINGASANQNTSGGTVTPGVWQHVVGVWDGAANILYVNGVQVATTATASFLPNSDPALPLTVGVRSDNGFQSNGSFDEAAYYNTALSPAQILAHYQNGTNTAPATPYHTLIAADGAVGYWRMSEPTPAYPVAANTGTLGAAANANYQGGVINDASGPSSPAFPGFGASNPSGSFNGTNGFVGSPLGLLNNRAKFTVLGWVKRGAVHSTRGGYFGQNDLLEFGDAAGGVSIEAWVDAAGGNLVVPYPWADDTWGFIALTADGTTARLFLDGAEAATLSANVTSYGTNGFKFNIGGGGIFNGSGDYYNGNIDEVAMYDKALTAGRVLSLYMTATGSVAAPFMVSDPPTLTPAGTIYATTPFSLTAEVAGALPLFYQWRTNGVAIPGATATTYSKSSASTSDSASYDLVVTNAFGAVTSSVVTVTIDPAIPPSVDSQPVSRLIYPGGNARFTVAASGTLPITYQWKHAGTNLPGATNATLVVPDCGAEQTGSYQVGVTNVAGGVLSSSVTLSLTTPTAGTYEALVVGMDPVAYWRLGETSGTTAYDYAGNYDGTYNSVTLGAPGAISGDGNASGSFDGASSFVGSEPVLNGMIRFSLAGWVRRGGLQLPRTGLFGQNDSVEFGYINDQTIEAWDGAIGGGIDVANPFADSTWGFVVVTSDGTNLTIYANGRSVGTRTARTTSVTNSFGFNIGGGGIFDSVAANGNWFLGDLDEVAVFGRALTGQEICALYLKGTGFAGKFEPSISLINGTGAQTLTNVDFSVNDGGFIADTPSGQPETAWAYGTNWWSPGQSTAFGGDNVGYLLSPTNTVTKAGVVRLTFTHRYSFEIDFDGGTVEVSVNGGPFVYVPGANFDQNGYNGTAPNPAPSLAGRAGFIGNSAGHPGFITSSCLLAGVNPGDTINVRFVAAYDNNTTGDLTPSGWQVANFLLTEGIGNAANVSCPCGSLQRKQGDVVASSWVDLNTGAVVISTTQTNQQYFRIKP